MSRTEIKAKAAADTAKQAAGASRRAAAADVEAQAQEIITAAVKRVQGRAKAQPAEPASSHTEIVKTRSSARSLASQHDGAKVTKAGTDWAVAWTEPTPEPAPKAARKPRAKAAPVGAPAAATVPDDQTKARAYLEAAAAEGWVTEVEPDAVNKARLIIIAKRGDETILITFIDNKMDASQMPVYVRADGSRVLLRNASAAKKQMSTDPVKRVVAPVLSTRRSTPEPVTADQPRRSLPFDPATATDDEIVEHFSSGVRVVWRNSISKATDETIVPPRTKVKIADHPRVVGPEHRVVSFISITGQTRTVGLDRLLRATRLSAAKADAARVEFLKMYRAK